MNADVPGHRVRLNGKATEDYEEALRSLFAVIKHDVPHFDFTSILCITLDFEQALSNALRKIMGEEIANARLQGCGVTASMLLFFSQHLKVSISLVFSRFTFDEAAQK